MFDFAFDAVDWLLSNLCHVTTQNSEDLIYTAVEFWNHVLHNQQLVVFM